jgi:hypothetical protein
MRGEGAGGLAGVPRTMRPVNGSGGVHLGRGERVPSLASCATTLPPRRARAHPTGRAPSIAGLRGRPAWGSVALSESFAERTRPPHSRDSLGEAVG